MSHNSFGHLLRVTTFGESHGPAIGCVVDGCPPGIALTEADIQRDLDRRRPGQSKFVTQRQEPDAVRILSGVFRDERMAQQLTTGTPIGLLIENVDQRSKDYSDIRDKYRPGHADYTYDAKYGLRDYRGGGRQSARETAMRVAAGAIARKILDRLYGKVAIRGALVQMGTQSIDRARWDWAETASNPFFCPDAGAVAPWTEYLEGVRKQGSSVGAIVEVVAEGIPAGLGAPIYAKLDNELASALMSINAVKGVEIGDGFATAAAKPMPTKCAWEMTASPCSCRTMPAASWAASRPASPSWRASRSSRHPPSWPHAAPSTVPARRAKSSPRAVTILAWASGRCRWAKR
jgi:chorismate synthase